MTWYNQVCINKISNAYNLYNDGLNSKYISWVFKEDAQYGVY